MARGADHVVDPRARRDSEHRRVLRVFAFAAVVDEIQVAVRELGQAGGMLVGPGRHLGAEDAPQLEVRRRWLRV